MPRVAKPLSDIHVRKLSFAVTAAGNPKAALHPVGGVDGLRLQVSPPNASNPKGARSWIYKITIGSKRKEIDLGSYPGVSLKDARELARLKYESIKSGLDPVAEQRAKKAALVAEQAQHITFAEYSKRFINKQAKEYKSPEQVRRLTHQLTEYVNPHIGHLFIKDINREHIVQFLRETSDTFNNEYRSHLCSDGIHHARSSLLDLPQGVLTERHSLIGDGL